MFLDEYIKNSASFAVFPPHNITDVSILQYFFFLLLRDKTEFLFQMLILWTEQDSWSLYAASRCHSCYARIQAVCAKWRMRVSATPLSGLLRDTLFSTRKQGMNFAF